jgi:ankyrin repeat protein
MNNAAKYGHKEIVQMMLDSGANNYNAAMSSAAKYGHKEIVQMIKNYAKNF